MLPFSPSSTDQKYIVLRQGRVEEAKATLHTLRGDSYAEEKIVEVLWACQKNRWGTWLQILHVD
jgi:hypothetical protein